MSWSTKFAADAFGADEGEAPTIVNIVPAPNTPNIPRNQAISFDVVDASSGLASSVIEVVLDGITELCFDGIGFVAPYSAGSSLPTESQASNTDGSFRTILSFSGVRRSGGWPSPPTFQVTPIDTSGNEGV